MTTPCPACGHAMYFETDQLGYLHERCDQCIRNHERARLGLAPLTLIDARPVPPPATWERDEAHRRRSLEDDAASGALAKAYHAGLSTFALATRYAARPQLIAHRLKAAGVVLRPVGRRARAA